jgi:hypothetical protein
MAKLKDTGFPKSIFLVKTDKEFVAYLKDEIPAGKEALGKQVAVYRIRKDSIGTISVRNVAVIDTPEKKG